MISFNLPTPRIVVLAAGFSSRLGKPKALARIRGTSLLNRTLRVTIPLARPFKVIVVIPPRASRYRVGTNSGHVDFISNQRRSEGLASSVRCGIARAGYCAAVLFLPADLARLEPKDIERLIAYWRGARRRVVAHRTPSGAGTPLILPRALHAQARRITGDRGLRDWIRHLPSELVSQVSLPSANIDIDTPRDLAKTRRRAPALGPR